MDYEAWDEGTSELSLEEEAAYLRLCHQMYRRGQPVPVYERMLCSLWRCHQNKARPLLKRLVEKGKIIVLEDGRVMNERVRRELHVRETLRTRRVHAGHTGGIRSGDVRRKSLQSNDPDEAKRSTGQDKTGEDKRKKESCRVSGETPTEPIEPTEPTEPPEPPKPIKIYSDEFETNFWKPFPRTAIMSKKEAWREWMKLAPDQRQAACQAIEPYRKHLKQNPTLNAVHACRFLSQERFDGILEKTSEPVTLADELSGSLV